MYYVYFVQSLTDRMYYVGSTGNLANRIKEHNQGKTKSLKSKLPVKLTHSEEYNTKTEALIREIELKKNLSKKKQLLKV